MYVVYLPIYLPSSLSEAVRGPQSRRVIIGSLAEDDLQARIMTCTDFSTTITPVNLLPLLTKGHRLSILDDYRDAPSSDLNRPLLGERHRDRTLDNRRSGIHVGVEAVLDVDIHQDARMIGLVQLRSRHPICLHQRPLGRLAAAHPEVETLRIVLGSILRQVREVQRNQLMPQNISTRRETLRDVNPPAVVRMDQGVGDPVLERAHAVGEVGRAEEDGVACVDWEEAEGGLVDVAAAVGARIGATGEIR